MSESLGNHPEEVWAGAPRGPGGQVGAISTGGIEKKTNPAQPVFSSQLFKNPFLLLC